MLMNLLKKVALGLGAVVVLLTLVAYVLPRKVHVERTQTITAAPEAVFAQVNTLRNWEQWSPWHKLDPHMKLSYTGPAAGPGASYAWTSAQRNVGTGLCTITHSQPFSRIDTDLKFGEEAGKTTSYYLFEEAPEGTKVTWGMDLDMGLNPLGRYMGLLMDGMIGADFEKGLHNLQQVVGSQPVTVAP
ncbi:SRPBCC family protein [Hymenobacter sp. BT730]|uniref:SRPBCC family protein n=1 Tax=Hymenobacter sp. BT730 TaxID=3063332 RepID=UPI0026DF2AFE|nr:SRPBCC family protein [Hymenobacter sp. BT730]